MMRYSVFTVSEPVCWEKIPHAPVESYTWGCSYRPKVFGQLCFIPEKGFRLKMTCYETSPLAKYENPDDMVCKDSCMEFFVNFFPNAASTGYLNFEANSKGTLLLFYGKDRSSRTSVREMGLTPPKVNASVFDDHWEYEIEIPLSFIRAVYGQDSFVPGSVLKGNFYKCGDDTDSPHYGSWSPIANPTPDFHRPEFFGELVLEPREALPGSPQKGEAFLEGISRQVSQSVQEFLSQAKLQPGDILVVGCSSSEILGEKIGTHSSLQTATAIYEALSPILKENGLFLAAQCCEHLNRALIVEKACAQAYHLEPVNVVPQPKAGGSFASCVYESMAEPVAVENIRAQAGMDIGDTLIGMHLRQVAVPVRVAVREIGYAHVTFARTRAKFVGGARAVYNEELL